MSTSATLATVADTLIKLAEKRGWLDKLVDLFKERRSIVVLGGSGCGKTTFINSLNTDMPEVISFLDRTEVAKRHHLNFKGARLTFVDTPGQGLLKEARISAIRKTMKADALGVINLVAYGYHEDSVSLSDAITARGKVSKTYLQKCQTNECAWMTEWIGLLGSEETTSWFMTVVNKADLWWDEREDVLNHYQSGPYYQSLGDMQKLKPRTLEYSSVIHKFYNHGRISGGFDIATRNTLRAHLISTVIQLSKDA